MHGYHLSLLIPILNCLKYFNFNGEILTADTAAFTLGRAINYGDGMFESIRIHNGEILFLEDHFSRMVRAMKALKMPVPENFSIFFFHKQIIDLAQRENTGPNARVRIGVYRSDGGLYEPQENSIEYFIEVIPLSNAFEWNQSDFKIGLFEDVRKDFSSISFFKSMSALPYVMASIYKSEQKLSDCLLKNSAGKIVEATSSNLFWIRGDKIFSPPLSDGAIEGIMRKNLIWLFAGNKVSFSEQSINEEELQLADEMFLTNVGWGIKPVTQFLEHSMTSKMSHEIFHLLEKTLQG